MTHVTGVRSNGEKGRRPKGGAVRKGGGEKGRVVGGWELTHVQGRDAVRDATELENWEKNSACVLKSRRRPSWLKPPTESEGAGEKILFGGRTTARKQRRGVSTYKRAVR